MHSLANLQTASQALEVGDLPFEKPMRLSLVINRKAADALRIEIPQELLLRADEVIQ